jgi:hypothetical protein
MQLIGHRRNACNHKNSICFAWMPFPIVAAVGLLPMNAPTAHPSARDEPRPHSANDGDLGFARRTALAGIAALPVAM